MGWQTTADLDKFLTAAGQYLRGQAAENIVLLTAANAARDAENMRDGELSGRSRSGDPLYGWWEPPDGGEPRGAFLHDPSAPLLIAVRAPETAAALAAPLSRAGRLVSAVEARDAAADAFADAWRQRAGVAVKMHRISHVHRLAGVIGNYESPPGRARSATWADRELLVAWLRAFGNEVGDLTGIPEASADGILGYGGAAFWEADGNPVAMAMVAPAVAGVVRVSNLYTPPQHRGHAYAIAVLVAVSRAALVGRAREVVFITDSTRPMRRASRLGFELIEEQASLSFGPPTGPIPRVPTGPMPRVPTGPMPRMPTGPIPRFR
jgi:predicted GNAT family acetyltransferase